MPVIVHSQILRVHAAAVAADLATKRGTLLAGIPQSLRGGLDDAQDSAAQLLSDLDRLNDLGQLPDGSTPLETWLENALALTGPRKEADVFREVLALTHGSGRSAAPEAPASGSAPAAMGGSTFHLHIEGSNIASLAVGDGATSHGRADLRGAPNRMAEIRSDASFAFPDGTTTPPEIVTYRAPSASAARPAPAPGLQSVYLSYAPADEPFVERLFQALEARGVATFYFPLHAPTGQKLGRVARVGVNQHDRVLLVCSRASLSDPRVQNELEQTLEREAREGGTSRLIPVNLDNFARSPDWKPPHPDVIHEIQGRVMVEMVGGERDAAKFQQGIERLIRALKG